LHLLQAPNANAESFFISTERWFLFNLSELFICTAVECCGFNVFQSIFPSLFRQPSTRP
jgi:hypothetical protein